MGAMTPVLSREQMRAFDAHAIEKCRVPSLLLMENAGRGIVDAAAALLPRGWAGSRVTVVCGSGNNGGDGLVIARRLAVAGARPTVVMAAGVDKLSPDARTNLEAYRGIGGAVRALSHGGSMAPLAEALREADLVVDALFGTGLDRAIEGHLAAVVRETSAAAAPVLAVDLPSGLDANTGGVLGVAVEADLTATLAQLKLGLMTPNGSRLAGRVVVVDIGVPAAHDALPGPLAQAIEVRDLATWVRPRAPGAHKTTGGHVLVIGGSPGKVGAPQLVARGAMRAGAGLTTLATWPETAATIEAHVLESMTARIARDDPEDALAALLGGKHAVVVGPGLGTGPDARSLVERVLRLHRGPIVVDADALTMFARQPGGLSGLPAAVLTPHPGELARITDTTPPQVEADRFAAARGLARATGAVVVLKGAHTVVAAPDARIAVSPVACPALATAGSGDVLGGVIGAMACALPPFEAACAGVMLHALAGQAWSAAHGGADRGMLASEIADGIPSVLPR
jgi:NAD(P)H-hydrate epimerase